MNKTKNPPNMECTVTMPLRLYEYYIKNKWKITAYDYLVKALEKQRTLMIVDSEGGIEIKTASAEWGIYCENTPTNPGKI